jgi:hypothetical protein
MNRYDIALGKTPPPKKSPEKYSKLIDNMDIVFEFGDKSYIGQLISLTKTSVPEFNYCGSFSRFVIFLNSTEDPSFFKQEAKFSYGKKRYSMMIQDVAIQDNLYGPNKKAYISGQAVEIYEVVREIYEEPV